MLSAGVKVNLNIYTQQDTCEWVGLDFDEFMSTALSLMSSGNSH